jgi:hypothetical protein
MLWQHTDFRPKADDHIANREVAMEQLDPLRQAAVTLLTAAPPGAVILAVRALLDGWEQDQPPASPVAAPGAR